MAQNFDVIGAHPLRQVRSQLPIRSRIGAITVTAAAHLVVIIALIAGLHQALIIHRPEIAVQFTPEKRRAVEPSPSSPLAPLVIDAAAPVAPQIDVNIPSAPQAAPTPPLMLPAPPNADFGTSNAEPTWETALLNRLAQAKHVPAEPAHGVVLLRFKMDRDGKVLEAKIEKSAGSDAMDQEALAALQRAQPLPVPPPEVPGNPLELIVPLDFP
jgi:periplasmic protein TonB